MIQASSWASTLVVARLLSPADFGLVGMAAAFVELARIVSELGLATVIVQRQSLKEEQIAQLGTISVVTGILLFVVSALLAPLVAAFFGEPAVRAILTVMGFSFVLGGLELVPRALLSRKLQFKKLSFIDSAESLVTVAVTLTLAFAGAGYWALVAGVLAGKAGGLFMVTVFQRHRIALFPRLGLVRRELFFGWQVLLARIGWYVTTSADVVIVGRFLGKLALGAYGMGANFASIPVDRLTSVQARVLPAVLSSVQFDKTELRRYVLNITQAVAFVTFPTAVGMALVANEFVRVALGDKWLATIPVLQLLALSALSRSLAPMLGQVLIATGNVRPVMLFRVTSAVVFPALFVVGALWGGTFGVAFVWLIAHPLAVAPFLLRQVGHAIGLSARSYLKSVGYPAMTTIAMAAVVVLVGGVIPIHWSLSATLLCKVVAGCLTYTALMLTFHQTKTKALLSLLFGRTPTRGGLDATERTTTAC